LVNFLNCFPARTLVATANGSRPIQTIKIGDEVWAYDLVASEWQPCRVLQTFQQLHEGAAARLQVAGELIECTALHPFWVVRGADLAQRPRRPHFPWVPGNVTQPGRWVDAADLQLGDELLLRDGRICPVEAIDHLPFHDLVYNLEVECHHCYAVGENGVLVHNNNGPATTLIETLARRLDSIRSGINFGGRVARAFRTGTAGQYFPLLGRFAEAVADAVIKAFPALARAVNFQTASHVIDRLLTSASRSLILEIKFALPRRGPAFARLIGQIREGVAAAAARAVQTGQPVQFAVWSLRAPPLATLRAIEQELGPTIFNQVQFINGVNGLNNWLRLFFR
jgi:hypothetical protein